MGTLHVTNGDSAAGTLAETGLGGEVLAWQDVLYEGPLPLVDPARQRELRAAFLSSCGFGEEAEILTAFEARDRRLRQALDAGTPIVLWFEHDLYDQLQLVQILALAGEGASLELINVGTFPGRPDFRGLGELTADELESLWPQRRPVDADVLALGAEAWDAVRSPDPTAVERFLERDTSALPFLRAALLRLLEERPDAVGLSRSERQLLRPMLDGPRTRVELFLAAQDAEEAPFEGDVWAFRRLDRLAAGPRPLVRLDGERYELTDAGRAVLAR
jgi:hypothetical protein